MAISSLGIGSGIDIGGLVKQLVAAQIQPQSGRLDRQEAGIQARLSGFSALKGALSSFKSSLSSLQTASSFQSRKATSSDEAVLKVSSTQSAQAAAYDVNVTHLATAHKLATDPNLVNAKFTAVTDTLSTGTLTFKFGTTDYDKTTDIYTSFTQDANKASKSVVITDASLQGISDAVNNADIGVSSSIIFDGTNYRLAFVADTGAANSLEISVSDDDTNNNDDSGLSLLAFNSTATHMEQTAAAQDSIALVNGITVSSDTTAFYNVIAGVTLNVLKAGSASVNVDINKDSTKSAVNTFVNSYNSLVNTINDLSSYDAETGESGILNGDSILRSVDNQIRRLLGAQVSGTDGAFSILADIGITRDAKNGTMVLDSTKLDSAITKNFDDIASLFASFGKIDDSLISLDSTTGATKVGKYSVNITQLATQGSLLGSAAANLTITEGVNDEVTLTVDGVSTSIIFSSGTYTAASLAAELQAKANGTTELSNADVAINVSVASGVFTLTSNRFGSASKIDITGGNGKADLIGVTPIKTDGLDVSGTIGGVAATGSGQYLTGTGNASGLKLLIEGNTLGNRGVVNYTRGYADQLNSLLTDMLGADNIFSSIDKSLKDNVDRINVEREKIQSRAVSIEKRLLAQFTAMDALVSRLQTTGNYLTQQLDSIGKISIRNNN
jgi:flagellar hook-associated protein 2